MHSHLLSTVIIFRCRAEEIVFYAGILAPFVITYSFNVIIYFIIIGSLSRQVIKKKGDTVNKEMLQRDYKKLAIVAYFLAIMFGLAWIFAILVVIPDTIVSYISQYLFSFFVGFQGLLYFIMHGLRSPDARQVWITLLYKPCPNRMPTFLKTWTTTSPIHQTKPPPHKRLNQLYVSEKFVPSPGDSTFNTLQRPASEMADMGASPSSYSLASQTIQIDFTLPTIISDDECSSMDLQELTDIINTKFSEPNSPCVAVSTPRLPPLVTDTIQNSPLTRQSLRMSMAEKEYKLHMEMTNEGNHNEADETLNLAYDSVIQNYDSTQEQN